MKGIFVNLNVGLKKVNKEWGSILKLSFWWVEPKDAAKHPTHTGQSPQQILIRLKTLLFSITTKHCLLSCFSSKSEQAEACLKEKKQQFRDEKHFKPCKFKL